MLPKINAPDTVERFWPATPGVEYNQMWLSRANLDFSDPNSPGRVCFLIQPMGKDLVGQAHLSPARPMRVDIERALEVAHGNAKLMQALFALNVACAELAGLGWQLSDSETARVTEDLRSSIRKRGRKICDASS
jgi:hypothetical protein